MGSARRRGGKRSFAEPKDTLSDSQRSRNLDAGPPKALPRWVCPRLNESVPLEALRDLIGICRALYAFWAASGAGPIELDDLMQIGKDLAEAHRLARNTEPNTLGHRAAWSRAEEATRRLGHLVGELEQLKPVVAAATRRIIGPTNTTVVAISEREAKRIQRRTRS